MDPLSTNNDLPWPLIVSALQGELSSDESPVFGEWLAASPANRGIFGRLQQIWKDEMTDYGLYAAADEHRAWEALRQRLADVPEIGMEDQKLEPGAEDQKTEATAGGEKTVFNPKYSAQLARVRRWTLAAALVVLSAGAALLYLARKGDLIQYATSAGQQKKVSLPDGSVMVLRPQTRLQLAQGYNTTGRTVVLLGGEASFDVSHQSQLPFVVDMDVATVRDIGTNFTITRTMDSIQLTVSEGRVAFTVKETGETRELSAGASLCLYITAQRRGEITTSGVAGSGTDLRFDDAPLSEVITALQKQFDKKILLQDTAVARERLTVHLDGESLENAIRIICTSMNLESAADSNGYVLKTK